MFGIRVTGFLLFLLMIASWSKCEIVADHSFSARVERIAAQLPWLSIGDVLYNRDHQWGPDPDTVAALLNRLDAAVAGASDASTGAGWTKAADLNQLKMLLSHKNAKVRTLGIVILYHLRRVDVLADIAALADDSAETFPQPGVISAVVPLPDKTRWPLVKATVANYARRVIERYVLSSYPRSFTSTRSLSFTSICGDRHWG